MTAKNVFLLPNKTYFKFFKTKNGVTSFAALALEATPGPIGEVQWAEDVTSYALIYSLEVESGTRDALTWHMDRGGTTASFKVLEFTELVVDTKPDAVRCAATAAAWKSLGNNESELAFEFDGAWRVLLIG